MDEALFVVVVLNLDGEPSLETSHIAITVTLEFGHASLELTGARFPNLHDARDNGRHCVDDPLGHSRPPLRRVTTSRYRSANWFYCDGGEAFWGGSLAFVVYILVLNLVYKKETGSRTSRLPAILWWRGRESNP